MDSYHCSLLLLHEIHKSSYIFVNASGRHISEYLSTLLRQIATAAPAKLLHVIMLILRLGLTNIVLLSGLIFKKGCCWTNQPKHCVGLTA